MKYYTSNIMIDLSASIEDKEFTQAGDFLMYDKGSKPIQVKLDSNKNHSIELRPKDIIRSKFSKLYVSSDAAENVYLKIIGSSDNSVVVVPGGGVVEQILEDKSYYYNTIKNENSFIVSRQDISAGSTSYRGVNLINPSTSGIYIILDSLKIATGDTTKMIMDYLNSDTQYANDSTEITPLNLLCNSTKLSQGLFYDTSLVSLPSNYLIDPNIINPGNRTINIAPDPKLILSPGSNLGVFNKTVNSSIRITAQWTEIPI